MKIPTTFVGGDFSDILFRYAFIYAKCWCGEWVSFSVVGLSIVDVVHGLVRFLEGFGFVALGTPQAGLVVYFSLPREYRWYSGDRLSFWYRENSCFAITECKEVGQCP